MEDEIIFGSKLTLREDKGKELTHDELDGNFKILDAKIGKTVSVSGGSAYDIDLLYISDDDCIAIVENPAYNKFQPIGFYEIEITEFGGEAGQTVRKDAGTVNLKVYQGEGGEYNCSIYLSSNNEENIVFSSTNSAYTSIRDGIVKFKVEFVDFVTKQGIYPYVSMNATKQEFKEA